MKFYIIVLCFALTSAANGEEDLIKVGNDSVNVRFFLHTPTHLEHPIEITEPVMLEFQNITMKNVKFFSHGMTDNASTYWSLPLVNGYMKTGVWNVISVDWQEIAYGPYLEAVRLAPSIGDKIGKMVIDIAEMNNIDLCDIHLIGHSLGAHVMGFAGAYIDANTGTRVGRITGLDPAGPLFLFRPDENRLDATDAYYVDIIHTDGLLGNRMSLGHADFWPNGGIVQAGCGPNVFCSHKRAPLYFAESIGNFDFPAWACDSTQNFLNGKCFENVKNYLGENANPNYHGQFYLRTNSESPFGIPQYDNVHN